MVGRLRYFTLFLRRNKAYLLSTIADSLSMIVDTLNANIWGKNISSFG